MKSCEQLQNQLFDHLYGLLDADDSRDLAQHLEHCGDCQAALARAQAQQRLLATAAKKEFPEFHFVIPTRPEVVRAARRPVARWAGWAVAAAALLAIAGPLGKQTWSAYRVWQAEGAADRCEQMLVQAREEAHAKIQDWMGQLSRAEDELRDLSRQQQKKLAEIDQAAAQRDLNVAVTGPASLEPGAANDYQLSVTNRLHQPVSARISAQVVDATSKTVLYEEKDLATDGSLRLDLPASLPVKPRSNVQLLVHARTDGAAQGERRETWSLTAPLYLTQLATDKPMYQPGEVVHFRSLTLERFSLRPASQDMQLVYTVTKPNGEKEEILRGLSRLLQERDGTPILGPTGKPVRGIGAGEYVVDPAAPGGEYTLSVSEIANHFPPQERKFLVNRYEKPLLNKELEFGKKTYGPGELVLAACKARRATGEPVADAAVAATVQIDGRYYGADGKESATPIPGKTDGQGGVNIQFALPRSIERGQATLTVIFHDGGVVESIVRAIPVLLKRLNVDFYAEGGQLVAGVPNRVYFQASTTLDKPAELSGHVVDDQGRITVAHVETLNHPSHPGANQGMGVFTFTPESDRRYELKIDAPAGVQGSHLLPEAEHDGVVLHVPSGVTGDGEPIHVQLWSGRERALLVGAYCRGELMAQRRMETGKKQPVEMDLRPEGGVGGVYRITVFEMANGDRARLVPRAERLVYRVPSQRLKLTVQAEKQHYTPGDRVKLHVSAKDENDRPAPAVLMMAVTDKSVVKLADEKTLHSLPTHFLLTTEVRRPEDLEHADFLLSDHPQARQALDLLLGTQGWRRFAEQNPDEFRKHAEDAVALLANSGRGNVTLHPADTTQEAKQRVLDDFFVKAVPLDIRIADLEATLESARAILPGEVPTAHAGKATGSDPEVEQLKLQTAQAEQAATEAVATANRVRKTAVAWSEDPLRSRALQLAALGMVFLALLFFGAWATRSSVGSPVWPERMGLVIACGLVVLAGMSFVLGALTSQERHVVVEDRLRSLAIGLRSPSPVAKEKRDKDRRLLDVDSVAKKRRVAGMPALLRAGLAEAEPAEAARGPQNGPLLAMPAMLPPPIIVREYAHQRSHAVGEARQDLAETLYWHPALVLANGTADVSFDLSDSVTTFQILAAGHTLDGRLGAITTELTSQLPLTIQPKLPIEVTSSDKIDVPVTITNNSEINRTVDVTMQADAFDLLQGNAHAQLTVRPGERARRIYRVQPDIVRGGAKLRLQASSPGVAGDGIERTLSVVPEGFPIVQSKSDVLSKSVSLERDLVLPESWIPGTLKCQVEAFPSTLADLQNSLEGMLREPYGCFEQTSSSNYPNVLALDYMKESSEVRPEFARRAQTLLASGYEKLVSFECLNSEKQPREGYEWFGGTAPAHEALTAYGLMEFRDMARVYDVDAAMVERTRAYLMSRRDGKGGFLRNPRALDRFGNAPAHVTNAYIVWALTESGPDDVHRELNALAVQAESASDPYFVALVATSLLNRGRTAEAVALFTKIAEKQQVDGHLDAAETSITGSGGRDLQIETTALALYGWMKAKRPDLFLKHVQTAVRWIGQQRGGYGGFGSTQSTVLALKALVAYARVNRQTAKAGDVILWLRGHEIARKHFAAGAGETIIVEVPDPEKNLAAGHNDLRVSITAKNTFPFTATWSYQTLKPASDDNCPIGLSARLDRNTAVEGETVRLNVQVENRTGKGQGMTVAIIGLPAGLTLPEDLKDLKDLARAPNDGTRPKISYFELRGRELVLYWRDLPPDAGGPNKIDVSLPLICRVPGEYRGPASRAYLYYNADHKTWVEPIKVSIRPNQALDGQ